ncbi:MAG: hypothetical protein NUV69_05025 [Candidatus Curtissbacteria bacterium]|nr:hypothetical protein [Candidatus Curtissbacteria bacterium]
MKKYLGPQFITDWQKTAISNRSFDAKRLHTSPALEKDTGFLPPDVNLKSKTPALMLEKFMRTASSAYLLVFLVTLIALWPFFRKGFYQSHDGEWMVIRFSAFHQTLAAGQFPVRFVDRLNNNYGYPVLNFLYPLPFYLAEFPKAAGLGFVESVKVIFVTSTIFSSLAMFWALSQKFSKAASTTGAIVYTFAPYRFVDLYVRGSIGESMAFAFVPLILGSIFKIEKGDKKFFPILSISTFFLILSHNVIALLFIPLLFISALLIQKKSRLRLVVSLLLGIAASSLFWIPALYDLKFVRLSQIKVSEIENHLVSLEKLLLPSWGYNPNPNDPHGMSVQIGLIAVLMFIATLILILKTKGKNFLLLFYLSVFAMILFLLTKQSQFFWQTVSFVDIIQFPWRMLSIIVFVSAIMTAYVVDSIPKKQNIVALIILISAILAALPYTRPSAFVDRAEGYYATNEDTTTVRDEYMPLWVKEKSVSRANEKVQVEGKGEVTNLNIRPANYQLDIKALDKLKVQVNTIYFPGWQVRSNGQTIPIDYQNNLGLIRFYLPEGTHKVIIKYTRSSVHLAAEVISLAALFVIGAYFIYIWRKQDS